jgi:hypothetical protein
MNTTVRNVILILRPSEKVKKPKSILAVEKPTFKALKKKFFTGPVGKILLKINDNAEPIIPPITIPNIILPTFLLAILLLFIYTELHR